MVSSNSIGREEYSKWLTPTQTIRLLRPWGPQQSVSAVYLRLKTGKIAASCESLTWRIAGQTYDADYEVIDAEQWDLAVGVSHFKNDFWTVGDVVFAREGPFRLNSDDDQVAHKVRFFPPHVIALREDADIEPVDVPLVAKTSAPPTPAEGPLPPKVTPSELLAWARDYGAANPDAKFADFLLNAKRAFRSRRVTERPLKGVIAKLGMTKSRGNPAIKR